MELTRRQITLGGIGALVAGAFARWGHNIFYDSEIVKGCKPTVANNASFNEIDTTRPEGYSRRDLMDIFRGKKRNQNIGSKKQEDYKSLEYKVRYKDCSYADSNCSPEEKETQINTHQQILYGKNGVLESIKKMKKHNQRMTELYCQNEGKGPDRLLTEAEEEEIREIAYASENNLTYPLCDSDITRRMRVIRGARRD